MKHSKKIIREIAKIKTFGDWRSFCKENNLKENFEISHRGGYLGVKTREFVFAFLENADEDMFPSNVGVYCNYLGGGMRGSINYGGHSDRLSKEDSEIVDTFCEACKLAYVSLENMEDEDGEPIVPDDVMTGYARANVVSAY